MARPYNPTQSYRPELDVRAWDDLAELIADSDPDGLLWPLVGPRRSGKTWALRGLLHDLGEERAEYIDLGRRRELSAIRPTREVLLIDEPGKFLFAAGEVGRDRPRSPQPQRIDEFFRWCERSREKHRLLLAMTPAEWSALCIVGRAERRVSDKDLQPHLRPLSPAQARRIAHDPRARALLEQVAARDPDWLRNPFLVRLLLDTADIGGKLQRELEPVELGELLGAVRDLANGQGTANYVRMVLYEGLADLHQDALRAVARGEHQRADPDALELLRAAGLVGTRGEPEPETIRDPIVAAHLPPPLRIHHISDLHAGPKSSQRVNQAGLGPVADRLSEGAGRGTIRDSYREHVEQRAALGLGPHLVIVSGDLSETGRDEEYAEIRTLLRDLNTSPHPDLDPDSPRVLIVGGNHDVDWSKTRGEAGARDRHRRFAAAFDDFPRPRLEEAPETRTLTTVAYVDAGIEVALLGSAEFGGEIDELLVELVDNLTGKLAEAASSPAGDALATVTAQLTDSAHSGDPSRDPEALAKLRDRLSRLDPGLVHRDDLSRLRAHPWRAPVRLAVLHHPLSPIPTTTDIAPYAGLINAGAVKDAMLASGVTLALHGHMHSSFLAVEHWAGHPQPLRIAAAPSLSSRETSEHHGYNELLVYREGDSYELEVRAIARVGESWSASGKRIDPFVVPS